MSFFGMVIRLMLNFATKPEVQGALSAVGRYAVRQASAQFIKAVQRGTRSREAHTIR